eukprot:3036279-Rhodomonas_salina.1
MRTFELKKDLLDAENGATRASSLRACYAEPGTDTDAGTVEWYWRGVRWYQRVVLRSAWY